MEKLSPENIRFIDTYLKESGVEYLDIRTEMVDHVASEIEARQENGEPGEFYDLFKAYMAKNKKPLLQGLKKYRQEADRKVFKQVLRNLYHPMTLILGGLLALGSQGLVQFFELERVSMQFVHMLFMIVLFIAPYWGLWKLKFSFANGLIRCVWLLYILIIVNDMMFEFYNFWYFLVLFIYEVALLKTNLALRSHYRNKYSVV